MNSPTSIFDRSGLIPRSDFDHEEWRRGFGLLEAEQAAFLRHETAFRSAEYRWPRDPLHSWSRAWELEPASKVSIHVANWNASNSPKSGPTLTLV